MPALDLDAVDELCRLALVAGRLGCRVRLEGATDELRDLLDLAGVKSVLFHDPDATADPECGVDEGDLA